MILHASVLLSQFLNKLSFKKNYMNGRMKEVVVMATTGGVAAMMATGGNDGRW